MRTVPNITSRLKRQGIISGAILGLIGVTSPWTATAIKGYCDKKALNQAEIQSAQTCIEMYGRTATSSPGLLELCQEVTKMNFANARRALHSSF